VPDQEPGSAESVCPTCAAPEIVGGAPLEGAVGAGLTTAEGAEPALLEPDAFEAVT
jgi:hypothetical protein